MSRHRKVRFVVGLFDALADLRAAVEALVRGGLGCERLCVLAKTATTKPVSRASAGPAQAGALPALARDGLSLIVVKPTEPGKPPLLVSPPSTSGRAASDPKCAIDPELVAGFPNWVSNRQARQLEDQLELGGSLLFVRVSDAGEQTEVGRTLLRHAHSGVQTHDFVV